MKKTVFAVLLVLLWLVSVASAAELKVGDKVGPMSLKDAEGKVYTLDSAPYAGKVIAVYYTIKKDEAFSAQLEKANIDRKTYEPMAIVNIKDISIPNFVLKKAIKTEQEKIKSPILLDDNYTLVNAWGLNKKAYNVVLIDKTKVCRYIYRSKDVQVPAVEGAKLIALIKEYQAK
jgi:predicted transcriptional regulator